MKRVAVIILNWNGKNFLQKFLPSVLSSCKEVAKVFVADNASSDSSKEVFDNIVSDNDEFIDSEWIALNENFGFTGGYNRAIDVVNNNSKSAQYDYIVLLNSDILTTDGWLKPIVDFMDKNQQVAVCQPKILSYSDYEAIQNSQRIKNADQSLQHFEYAGASGGFIDKYGFPFCRGRILSSIEVDLGQYDTPTRTFWATGACMVVRNSVWQQIGGLDERFFAHMEEIDFCWRAALLGYEIWCIPHSFVYHVGGGTLPNNSPQKLYLNYRNNLIMLRKNLPLKSKGCKLFLRKILDGLSAIVYCLQGKFSFASAVYKGHRDYNKIKKTIQPSERNTNNLFGIYNGSIVLRFFLGGKKFDSINF